MNSVLHKSLKEIDIRRAVTFQAELQDGQLAWLCPDKSFSLGMLVPCTVCGVTDTAGAYLTVALPLEVQSSVQWIAARYDQVHAADVPVPVQVLELSWDFSAERLVHASILGVSELMVLRKCRRKPRTRPHAKPHTDALADVDLAGQSEGGNGNEGPPHDGD
eukprot:2861377-Alexandrium_andersonii.AAC.1